MFWKRIEGMVNLQVQWKSLTDRQSVSFYAEGGHRSDGQMIGKITHGQHTTVKHFIMKPFSYSKKNIMKN